MMETTDAKGNGNSTRVLSRVQISCTERLVNSHGWDLGLKHLLSRLGQLCDDRASRGIKQGRGDITELSNGRPDGRNSKDEIYDFLVGLRAGGTATTAPHSYLRTFRVALQSNFKLRNDRNTAFDAIADHVFDRS